MEELRGLVAPLPSGAALIARLEAGADVELPALVAAVVREARQSGGGGGRGGGGAHAAAGGARPPPPLDGALTLVPGLQFLHPRGRADLALFDDRLVVRGAKGDTVVPYAAVKQLVILDSIPKDTKGRVWLYLHLDHAGLPPPAPGARPRPGAVVLQVGAAAELDVRAPRGVPGDRLTGNAAVVLCQALGLVGLPPSAFASPDPALFTSAAGAAGAEAYVKARQGFLFPTPAGLCFLEAPPLFVPHADVLSVELARAGGASATFDFYVHCRGGVTHEFSNMPREEVAAVTAYVRAAKLPTGPAPDEPDGSSGSGGEGAGAEGGVARSSSSGDESGDEDFAPSGSDDDAGGGRPAKKRRRGEASGEEAEGNGDEEDEDEDEDAEDEDEDEDEDEEDSDEDSDEDDDSDGSVELVSEDDSHGAKISKAKFREMVDAEERGE